MVYPRVCGDLFNDFRDMRMSDVKVDVNTAWIPGQHISRGRRRPGAGARREGTRQAGSVTHGAAIESVSHGPGGEGVKSFPGAPQRRYIRMRPEIDKGRDGGMKMLTLIEVADRLSLGITSVRKLMDEGSLRFAKFGRATRVADKDVDALIMERMIG
jgi:excisionase family DNA binding protein